MNKQKSRKKLNAGVYVQPWQEMLTDIRVEIEKAERHLSDLRQSERDIQRKIESGEPFPEQWQRASTQN